jgi:hypothetical protein
MIKWESEQRQLKTKYTGEKNNVYFSIITGHYRKRNCGSDWGTGIEVPGPGPADGRI